MAKDETVKVTGAQKQAARTLVRRSAETGRYVSAAVAKIADAKTPRTTA